MFSTIGHTVELIKTSASVLLDERRLIAFPVLSGVSLLIVGVVFFGLGTVTGTVNRAQGPPGPKPASQWTSCWG